MNLKIMTDITFVESLLYSLISIIIVFLILALICYVVSLLKFTNKEKTEIVQEEAKHDISIDDIKDDDMMVAALVATIDYRNEVKTDVRLKSIREIK